MLGGVESVQYAFYLKKDDVRIKTVWYTSNPSCEFELTEFGEYSVVGFIKGGDSISILEALGILYKPNPLDVSYDFSGKSINIFGSCVSRDLLEFEQERNFSLSCYTARSSVISTVSEALLVKEEDLEIASKFQKKQVYKDLTKSVWEEMREKPSDYLLIDFIDERFQIGKMDNSYFTLSNEFVLSHYLENQYKVLEREEVEGQYYLDGKSLYSFLDEFIQKVITQYSPEKVILHKAKHVNKYIDKKGRVKKFSKVYLQYNQKINKLLDDMYDYVEEKLSGCVVLDFSEKYYADENHKWGLSTMHYERDYYIRVLNELSSILERRSKE